MLIKRKEPDTATAVSVDALISTYIPALIFALGAGIVLPAVPALAKSYAISFGVASGIITAFLIGNVAGSLPAGWLIDRFGRRWVMIAGPLLTSSSALLTVFAHSFTQLIVLRFVSGVAAQMWLMGRLAAISEGAAPEQRGRMVSWMFGMDNTGKLAGPVLGGMIASVWGIRAPFAAYAALALLALLPLLLSAEPAEPPRAKASAGRRVLTLREIVQPRLVYFAIALCAGLTRGPLQADLLHLYAAFQYHLGPAQIGFLATGAAALTLPIGFLAGWMMDRFGRKRTMVPGFTGVTIAMLALAASAFFGYELATYIALFYVGVAAQALTGGSIQTVGADVAPPEARGTFLGLWRFTGLAGSALGPLAFAALAESAGYTASFLFTALAAAAVAALLIIGVPETR